MVSVIAWIVVAEELFTAVRFFRGQKNFGKAADVVEDYFNGDDPVPTTNGPLPLTYAVDVTDSKRRASFIPKDGDSMHSWPGS